MKSQTDALHEAITLLRFVELRHWVLTPSEAAMCRDRLRKLEAQHEAKAQPQDATVQVTGVSMTGSVK